MSELLDLTAASAIAAIRAGEVDPGELFDTYRGRAAADELNAFTWVAEQADLPNGDAPLAGVPLAVKDLFCTEGIPSQAGSRILEGYLPPWGPYMRGTRGPLAGGPRGCGPAVATRVPP